MRRLTGYVAQELWPPLLAGTLLFTAILSFGYFFVSSQWLQNVPLGMIGKWIGYQVPDTLVKVLPMALVLMTVVAFGRLSTERELIAVQSGGIGLGQIARPVAAIAGLVSLLALWLSLWVAPRANVETRSLYWDVLSGGGLSQLVNKTVELAPGLTLHMTNYDHAKRELQNVRLEQWEAGKPKLGKVIFAPRATFENDQLTLHGYEVYQINFAELSKLNPQKVNPFTLPDTVKKVLPAVKVAGPNDAPLQLKTELTRKQSLATYADAIGADSQGWDELTTQMRDPQATPAERAAARLNLNRKVALPLGNLVLALAALPFALRFGRSLGVSLGIALLIAVAYYLLFFLGLTIASRMPQLPEVGVWLANLVMALAGVALLRRA